MKTTKAKSRLLRLAVTAALAAVLSSAAFPAYADEAMEALYCTFQHGRGWTDNIADNTLAQAPADSYVTALKATLSNQPEGMTGTIAYQVNLSGSGWLAWEENYAQTGTTTTDMPLEAVRFVLTGQLADNYDIYYSVLQSGVWTDLVMNGQTAGVEGHGLRVDGVRIAVTAKGQVPAEPKTLGRVIDPTKPMVALTFDDGPSPYTAQILDSLEANGGRATFFMVGNRMANYSSTVRRMVEMGCEPASHTWGHNTITGLSESALISNLDQFDNTLQSLTGARSVVMRPPGGAINETSKNALARRGTPAILWSIDTLDWKTKNTQQTINVVLGQVQDGDIVLMHDLHQPTAAAAVVIIPELTKRGYQLVTVSELAAYRGGMQGGHTYSKFRP